MVAREHSLDPALPAPPYLVGKRVHERRPPACPTDHPDDWPASRVAERYIEHLAERHILGPRQGPLSRSRHTVYPAIFLALLMLEVKIKKCHYFFSGLSAFVTSFSYRLII